MYEEHDSRVLAVLERALHSKSRATRLRAVAMLAHVSCGQRRRWLAEACDDPDLAVRDTATIVLAWTCADGEHPWPEREDPAFDRLPPLDVTADEFDRTIRQRWRWEYTVEVWREDGLLVGTFAAMICTDDDEHAKRIALGEAILASAVTTGDRFDPEQAAAFIVAKRRVSADDRSQRAP